jgi:hypothetical protein
VGRAGFGEAAIDGRVLALRLKFFLETPLRIGFRPVAFIADRREGRFEQAQDDGPRAVPTGLRVDRADDRLHRVGQDGTALAALAVFLALVRG